MNITKHAITFAALAAVASGCVDNRPVRNGLDSESQYIVKDDLTEPNPKLEGTPAEGDDAWLYRINVVGASDPNTMDTFPGGESSTRLVRFRFREDALQVVDALKLQADDPEDPNDDDTYRVDRVLLEFPGQHVDVKLRESLDGERTNFLEENTERPWDVRQQFKVDWEQATLDPEDAIGTINGYFVKQCGRTVSRRLVPDSFEWDRDDQYLTFEIEVNYAFDVERYICYSWIFLAQHTFDQNVIDTSTIVYKFNFYRRGYSDYEPEFIEEKAAVNKKYGAFQQLNLYTDAHTGLLGGKQLLKRWNPNRTEPIVYYFAEGYPEKYKAMFIGEGGIQDQTNKVFEDAGASLRVEFKDHDFDGTERKLGDIRYSFVAWFQNQNANGPLGYGPSTSDPRTGEVFSANVNAYNYAYDLFRYYTEEYLQDAGGADILSDSCEPGTTAAPADATQRLDSALFNEMRFVMDLPADRNTGTPADFVPTPQADTFDADFHRILPEIRYGYPGWNAYTFQTLGQAPMDHWGQMVADEAEFQRLMFDISTGFDPFEGVPLHTREGIEAQNAFNVQMRHYRRNHERYTAERALIRGMRNIYDMGEGDFLASLSRAARRCKDDGTWESNEEFTDRFIEGIIYNLMLHEFGHTIGLRHNFYGSMDKKHKREGEVTASVMDYVSLQAESGSKHQWGLYDEWALKWIYGTESVREEAMQQDPLYCTDEHRILSSLCRAYDYGETPAEIVLNAIDDYDWNYTFRNRRAFRRFWSVGSYASRVYSSIFDIQRMWYLAIFDWGGGGVQESLKRLDQTEGKPVLTQAEYDERSVDFYNDLVAANGMMIAFYDAVINQSASFRNYQTEFDPFYSDIRRVGIINDKLFATYAYMDLQDVYYSPNVATYVSMFDAPFGTENLALAQRVMDNMLGSNYDTFPWFRYLALNIFGYVTNTNLVGGTELKERIAIWRFNNWADLTERFPAEAVEAATRADNPQQVFTIDGEEYVYTYVADRSWHLVAGRSRSPVSYQYMRDYNESLNGGASASLDNYGLKILLAYHEYYNNFVGF